MNRKAVEELISIAEELDEKGMTEESTMLTTAAARLIERKAAEEGPGGNGMNGKTNKALNTLNKALDSFNNKNLDSRGGNRRGLSGVLNEAEDLAEKVKALLGE